MVGIAQYFKDKLLLGEREIEDRDIGVYIKSHSAVPSVANELLSELNQADFAKSLESRRRWFEEAAKSVLSSHFSGVRLEIALELFDEQVKNPFTYTLAFMPDRLNAEIREKFSTKENYYNHLSAQYSVHIYEDSLSVLLSSIYCLSDELDSKMLSESEKRFFYRQASNTLSFLLWQAPGVTPEEYKVLINQAKKRLRSEQEKTDEDALYNFLQIRLLQDEVVGYIKGGFNPDLGNFGSRFSHLVGLRITDTFKKEHNFTYTDNQGETLDLDDIAGDNFGPNANLYTQPEVNQQVEYINDILDKSLTKKQKFLFKMKYIEEFSHDKTAAMLREQFESDSNVQATNINYRLKGLKDDFIKGLRDFGVENPEGIYDELINLLKGKTPKK